MLVFNGLFLFAMFGIIVCLRHAFPSETSKGGEAFRDVIQHWQTKSYWKQSSKSFFATDILYVIHHHTMCTCSYSVRRHIMFI